MSTTWENCPQGFMWPYMMGLERSTSEFTFTAAVPTILSLDLNNHFAVTSGYLAF